MFQVQMFNGPATRRIVARENGQTVAIAESQRDGIVISIQPSACGAKIKRLPSWRKTARNSIARTRRQQPCIANTSAAGLRLQGGNPLIALGMVIPREPFRQFERPATRPPDSRTIRFESHLG